MIEKVLIADDEEVMLLFLAKTLKRYDIEVLSARNGLEAIKILETESIDLVISDVKMPHKNGIDLLLASQKLSPSPPVILITGDGTVESAVEAMKIGAFYYLIKPFSPDAIEGLLKRAQEHIRLVKENRFFKETKKHSELIAQSPSMQKILKNCKKIAQSQASIFIDGESGTGKEVIASYIHQLSPRNEHPFIKVNCAAIAEGLIESEFFGHEKGSFTGAHTKKIGRFELADKGTLLLDEVTEIPIALQPKLLRAIQEQEFERVGGGRPIRADLRFLATSNRNMQEAIETKVFREDLYYRLNVIPIHIPPLRERKEDILPLAKFFLEKFCKENHKGPKTLENHAEEKLLDYSWPGNVRELANIIERTVVLDFDSHIEEEHLYLDRATKPKHRGGTTLYEMEKKLILETLETHFQNRKKAAQALGISVRTLRNKLHEYGESALDSVEQG